MSRNLLGLLSASKSSSSSSSSMRLSDGELDRSFKFGGLPKFDAEKHKEMRKEKEKEKRERATLSNIIPPPEYLARYCIPILLLCPDKPKPQARPKPKRPPLRDSDPTTDLYSAVLEDDSVLKLIYCLVRSVLIRV